MKRAFIVYDFKIKEVPICTNNNVPLPKCEFQINIQPNYIEQIGIDVEDIKIKKFIKNGEEYYIGYSKKIADLFEIPIEAFKNVSEEINKLKKEQINLIGSMETAFYEQQCKTNYFEKAKYLIVKHELDTYNQDNKSFWKRLKFLFLRKF